MEIVEGKEKKKKKMEDIKKRRNIVKKLINGSKATALSVMCFYLSLKSQLPGTLDTNFSI